MAVRMLVNKFGSKYLFMTSISKLEGLTSANRNSFHLISALNGSLFISWQHTHAWDSTSLLSFPGDAVKISMPSLSPTMQQGTIVKWYKKEGDSIAPGELLCDIQTDKAVVGFEVEEEGILAKILKPENSANVEVGSLIALIVEMGADWKNVHVPADTVKEVAAPKDSASTLPVEPVADVHQHSMDIHSMGPAVRLLLEQYAIKPGSVPATGPSYRLLKGDVLNFIKARNLSPAPLTLVALPAANAPVSVTSPPAPVAGTSPIKKPIETKSPQAAKAPVAKGANFVDTELTNMRSVIAKRLSLSKGNRSQKLKKTCYTVDEDKVKIEVVSKSLLEIDVTHSKLMKQTIPHSYATVECCIDKLMATRKQLANEGIKVGVNDFIIKAAALALQKVPEVNAVWSGDAPRLLSNIDISVAVATDNGLITPIVKNAIGLRVDEIAAAVKDLATRARAGKLKLDEFQGGSFTISNLGMFGITSFSAVINPPQACILAVGTGQSVLRSSDDGTISTSTVVSVTTSCDARMVDDAVAASFLAALRDVLENPMLMLGDRASQSAPRYELQKLFAK